jgi:hypothetical protein
MQKKTEKTIIALLFIGAALLVSFYYFNSQSAYKFSYEKDNVKFVSNEAEPVSLMREFNLNDTVFISPGIMENASGNNYISSAFNLVQIVFIGNGKNTVSLWRVVSKEGSLLSCRTNLGNISKDIELSVQDCRKILDDKNNAIVLLSLPTKAQNSIVAFSNNRIEIVPEKIEKMPLVSFSFLKTMYANAELIVSKTNSLTGLVR